MEKLCEECDEMDEMDGPRPDDPDFAYDDEDEYDVDGPAYDMPIGC